MRLKNEMPANLALMFNHHHLPTDVCGLIGGYLDQTDSLDIANVVLRMPRDKR